MKKGGLGLHGLAAVAGAALVSAVCTPISWAQVGISGDFPQVAAPPENPVTTDKVLLGMALFFEEQLSADGTMACATCHVMEAGGGDPRSAALEAGVDGMSYTGDDELGSRGVVAQDAHGDYLHHPLYGVEVQPTRRNPPSMINAAFFRSQFWDQRAGPIFLDESNQIVLSANASLESQAVQPVVSSVEMGRAQRGWAAVTAKLASVRPLALAEDLPRRLDQFIGDSDGYEPLFRRAFGTDEITRERVAMAIASYERTLVSDRAPFDLGTLTPRQELGLAVYVLQNRGNCNACHPRGNGVFSNGALRTVSLPDHERRVKTPSLRNVGLRKRFMSSGQFSSLDEVLTHYGNIGFLDPLTLDEREALLDFIENGLTDPRVANAEPPFDRPTLRSELEPHGSRLFGRATHGSGGFAPQILADTPSNLGNPAFQVGVGAGLGGATAVLAITNVKGSATVVDGVPVYVDLASAELVPLVLSGAQPGEGVATFRAALPADPHLLGLRIYVQWFLSDPGARGEIAVSQAASYELFSRFDPRRLR